MKILLLDNFDSFTYNLFHLLDQFDGVETEVKRNDEIGLEEVKKYDRIVISPGPGLPSEAGITMRVLSEYMNTKPILGVCLGMQALAEACGGKIFNLPNVMHGVASETIITDRKEKLFKDIFSPFLTGRYHSWAVEKETLPGVLSVTAVDKSENIMALRHENNLLRGVQFHPESILTEYGKKMMENWLKEC
jgi:anthranilate synthase component 2